MSNTQHYRNVEELTSLEGVLVDEGSLWLFKNGLMILVDDDQYASYEAEQMDPLFAVEEN